MRPRFTKATTKRSRLTDRVFLACFFVLGLGWSASAYADIEVRRSGSSWARIEDDGTVRINGSSVGKIVKKILGQVPGLKKPMTGGFFYPRKGFGQISDALRARAEARARPAQPPSGSG